MKRDIKQQEILSEAIGNAFKKLDPRIQWKNPVMFIVFLGAILVAVLAIRAFIAGNTQEGWFNLHIDIWLWFTVLFANFAEAVAEGRGKAQAESLRKARKSLSAKKFKTDGTIEVVGAETIRKGDVVLIETGDIIPNDGEVIEGMASVDESAVTGESAPVIREAGGDKSSVTSGTKVLSDWLKVRVTTNPGETFLDRMISLVEGAKRQKTPNEIALTLLLIGLTIIFLFAVVTLEPFAIYSGTVIPITALVALLVCLIPTTIGGLLSAIGIAGMDRLLGRNVLAMSGRAVEAAGDVNVLLLDKTGTITLGNRMATEFIPAAGITAAELADAAQLASLADETPEGRSIVVLAKEKYGLRERDLGHLQADFIPFTAQTRMSGIDTVDFKIRKGSMEAMQNYVAELNGTFPEEIRSACENIAHQGGTPLVVTKDKKVMGAIYLKDIVKGGIRERFSELRRMGIKTIMITGDNQLTAAAIAAEAGVDDFLAEATPEAKLRMIRSYQQQGMLVAMTGDGTNDAPALAQADVGVAMNSGTQAAKEAGNMIDLDSNPTKLIEVVEIGKQLLMTRGSLTTFSIANDIAKYFAIIPALFAAAYGPLEMLNIMQLHSPQSAILSAVIFNALIIIALIPLAMKGVAYKPLGAAKILQRNLLIYGLGGIIVPFIGIKIIDVLLVAVGLA
ncbi:potassium-transporting ATPase subunit KdpB [uncultured Phascolarctobacterium sp.]|uniref:potassium-transporting ATPase subunit KdpB n=1 Tax=Phascolarctobacterium sp. TaxID=2049039 RepID=UPI0025D9D2AE|nr:potassium-transporting ATPase subunit KdpB [uncultured Phascolarctobacterium sp.]